MLLFRSEEHADRWCAKWKLKKGAVLAPEQCWRLADAWYRDRLQPHWQRRTPAEAEELFRGMGLTSEFWKLT